MNKRELNELDIACVKGMLSYRHGDQTDKLDLVKIVYKHFPETRVTIDDIIKKWKNEDGLCEQLKRLNDLILEFSVLGTRER